MWFNSQEEYEERDSGRMFLPRQRLLSVPRVPEVRVLPLGQVFRHLQEGRQVLQWKLHPEFSAFNIVILYSPVRLLHGDQGVRGVQDDQVDQLVH